MDGTRIISYLCEGQKIYGKLFSAVRINTKRTFEFRNRFHCFKNPLRIIKHLRMLELRRKHRCMINTYCDDFLQPLKVGLQCCYNVDKSDSIVTRLRDMSSKLYVIC